MQRTRGRQLQKAIKLQCQPIQLAQLADLIRQRYQQIVAEIELLERRHLANVLGERLDLVRSELKHLKSSHLEDGVGDKAELVVGQIEMAQRAEIADLVGEIPGEERWVSRRRKAEDDAAAYSSWLKERSRRARLESLLMSLPMPAKKNRLLATAWLADGSQGGMRTGVEMGQRRHEAHLNGKAVQ